MSSTSIPTEWLKLARKYNGWLAGGCVRDTYLHKPVKDIDIYTFEQPHNLPSDFEDVRPTSANEQYAMPYLKNVYRFRENGLDVEVMVVEWAMCPNMDAVIATFSESISQFWAADDGTIHYSIAAEHAMETGICVHYRSKYLARQLDYKPRDKIIRKFPEYQHVQEI